MKDIIEFYLKGKLIKSINSSVRLNKGDLINIEKITYILCGVTFSIDTDFYASDTHLRQNVDLIEFEL